MKIKARIQRVLFVMCVPFLAGAADSITITAPSSDGALAIMYNPTDGSIYAQAEFTGGVATINAGAVANGSSFAVKVTSNSGGSWSSDVYWDGGDNKNYLVRSWNSSTSWNAEVLTGEITSRSYNTDGGTRSVSFTLQAASDLSIYDNDNNALDAEFSIYRPSTTADDLYNSVMTRIWNPNSLESGFNYTVTDSVDYFKAIHVESDDGSFSADYIAEESGSNYELLFSVFEQPAGSVYETGMISFNMDGTVATFTADLPGTEALLDGIPYYLTVDGVGIWDDNWNYSTVLDSGLNLTSPDYYAVPEPASVLLIAFASAFIIFWRRRLAD